MYRTRVELKLTEIFPISQSFQKHLTAHVHKARIHLSTDDVYMHSTVCCHLLKNLQELCSVCSTYNITIQILLARISAHITKRNKLQYTEMHKWHHMCRDTLKHTHKLTMKHTLTISCNGIGGTGRLVGDLKGIFKCAHSDLCMDTHTHLHAQLLRYTTQSYSDKRRQVEATGSHVVNADMSLLWVWLFVQASAWTCNGDI